jgi:hypothetical protein
MSEVKPLNPNLYIMLRKRFGKVKISNEGERAVSQTVPDIFSSKKLKTHDLQTGEYYRVCCPACGDRRYRLYINYRWNTGENTIFTKYLACCFNEGCDLRFLDEEIKPYIGGKLILSDFGYEPPPKFKEITLPGKCVPLNELGDSHPATKYVVGRRFSPKYLFEAWGVQFCTEHPSDLIRNRLVIPFYWEGKLVGWQTRAIVPHADPKYYTMPGLQKANMLFNGDRARLFKLGVIVEGVFDAFRVGTAAVALLGTSVSMIQRRLIHAYWGNGGICIMLDSDAVDKMEKATNLFTPSAFKLGVFSVELPQGKDPADMSRNGVWKEIGKRAAALRIPVAG